MAAGAGSPGFCKLCASAYAPVLNTLLAQGKNNGEIQKFFREANLDLKWDRSTLYKHRDDHITHPLVAVSEESKKNPVIVPKSNRAALETIRDMGLRRAIENPQEVNVDHALKAASILNQGDKGPDNVMVIIAKLVGGSPEDKNTIIGEYVDVTPVQEESPVVEE